MKTTLNSEVFLSTFNELEKHFKNKLFRGSWKSFKQMLKEGSRNNPIIWQFKEELFEFTDLRNAIVHNRNHDYQVIAEPHDFVVKRFTFISNQIMNPKKVDSFTKNVHTCLLTDKISVPLNLIHNHLISQVPVLNHKLEIVEILNAGTIAYWLADDKAVSTEEATVDEVLKHKEHKGNFEIIPQKTTVYHAAEQFKNSYKSMPKDKYYDALLITKNGTASEKLSGIIVLSDIAEYV